MSRSIEEIAQEIEALLIENYHRECEEDPTIIPPEEQVITGIDFLITYDIRSLNGSSSGTVSLNLSGNQSGSTTIGLAHRGVVWVEQEYLYPDDDD